MQLTFSHAKDLPEGWKLAPVAAYCNVIDPQPDHRAPLIDPNGFPYIGIRDVNPDGTVNEMSARMVSEKAVIKQESAFSIEKGDIVFCKVGTLGEPRHLEAEGKRIALSATLVLIKAKINCCSRYLKHVLDSDYMYAQIFRIITGATRPALGIQQIRKLRLPFPQKDEQVLIANFLDKKTVQINEAIAIKEQQINLLKERKHIIIQKAVTQGIDPNVPLKDSRVDWIGKIPEHWEVKRAKYIFDEVDERSETGNEELLSVSHMTGVTPRSEKNVSMFMAEDYTGSKLCRENDLVINIMWAWMGALGVSNHVGIVSPSYGVFRQKIENTFNSIYLEYLLKSVNYVEYYNKVSTGLHSSRLRFYGHMFFAMKMGYPCYAEQNEIIAYLSEQTKRIDVAVDSQLAQIEKLKEYKTTLINSAVTGKIKITLEMVE
ncbi:EcoKI restriction-modification system protein HsdS [Pragia fontium]|uniref:restriction endonuclease subunit S n=1 Tax=Pragia fontium TaxID=82985 RepID=UPI000DFD85E8|nr:restriction endonuclease subunit S [Pragia fontium]SUB81486.1 EcoKI restriction-modification system protein HsdS [Pragia fontium]